jgi:cytidine deaminase
MSELYSMDPKPDPRQIDQMLDQAKTACENSYAPYSEFSVGAAVLDCRDHIYTGCNVENTSYGLTVCAERVALGSAVSDGARRILAAVIYTPTESFTPPCGACRQVLAEFNPMLEIHVFNMRGDHQVMKLDQLLPRNFILQKPGNQKPPQ